VTCPVCRDTFGSFSSCTGIEGFSTINKANGWTNQHESVAGAAIPGFRLRWEAQLHTAFGGELAKAKRCRPLLSTIAAKTLPPEQQFA
jgi:hypothetical protein